MVNNILEIYPWIYIIGLLCMLLVGYMWGYETRKSEEYKNKTRRK